MRCYRCKQKFEQLNKNTRCPFCGYNLILHREKISRLRMLVVIFLFIIYVIVFTIFEIQFNILECNGEKCVLKRRGCFNNDNVEILDEFHQKDIKKAFIKTDYGYRKRYKGERYLLNNYTLCFELNNGRIINTGLRKSNSSRELKKLASDIMVGKSIHFMGLR